MKFSKAVLASMLCLSIGLSGCSSKNAEEETETKGTTVETAVAERKVIETDYVYSGKIMPVEDINVFSTVQGKVFSVNCKIGDIVKAGDVLFTMDTEALEISKKQLEASLAAADAGIAQAQVALETVDGANYQMGVENLKASVENAQKNYENMKTTYENNKVLYEQGIISKTDMDNTELAYTQAKNAYENAKSSYELTTGKMLEENKKTAQAALNSATAQKQSIYAQIESVDKNLRDSVVTAPIGGSITACNVTAGELLSSASVPITITDTSKLKIDVNVSQRIVNSVTVGDTVSIRTETVDKTLEGKVKSVNPAANASGTYAVEIELDNSTNKLKPGMFAEVTFTNERSAREIVVDRDVVITKNGETYVFVDENGTAVKRIVETGIDNGTDIQITSGVEVGDVIVVKGQTYLSDGDKLNVVNAKQTEGADTSAGSEADSSETKGE